MGPAGHATHASRHCSSRRRRLPFVAAPVRATGADVVGLHDRRVCGGVFDPRFKPFCKGSREGRVSPRKKVRPGGVESPLSGRWED